MIVRTFLCLNKRCEAEFEAWDDMNPPCSGCGCVRVQWLPRGGHTMGTAPGADAEFRKLSDCFGLSDLRSAVRGEAAKKIAAQPHVDQRSAPSMQFAPGFAAVPHPSGAVCVPSTQNVTFKAKAAIGAGLPASRSVPGVHAGTVIEATHRPPR